FRLFLDDGHVDIDSNLVENAIRRPAGHESLCTPFLSN
ncbi:transposase, partial [Sinorhizobium meliloti]|nr:transposase [Sinorhizobium meliloti]